MISAKAGSELRLWHLVRTEASWHHVLGIQSSWMTRCWIEFNKQRYKALPTCLRDASKLGSEEIKRAVCGGGSLHKKVLQNRSWLHCQDSLQRNYRQLKTWCRCVTAILDLSSVDNCSLHCHCNCVATKVLTPTLRNPLRYLTRDTSSLLRLEQLCCASTKIRRQKGTPCHCV